MFYHFYANCHCLCLGIDQLYFFYNVLILSFLSSNLKSIFHTTEEVVFLTTTWLNHSKTRIWSRLPFQWFMSQFLGRTTLLHIAELSSPLKFQLTWSWSCLCYLKALYMLQPHSQFQSLLTSHMYNSITKTSLQCLSPTRQNYSFLL